MAKNVQNVRQITAVAAAYVGLVGQFIMDLELNVIRLHDGATPGGFLTVGAANNLSDLADPAAARVNLGLGTAATHASTDFDPAGTAAALIPSITTAQTAADNAQTTASDAAVKANNLSDLASIPTARTNLGLGTAAQNNTGDFDAAGSAAIAQANVIAVSVQKSANLSDLANAGTARGNLGLGTAAIQNTGAFDASGAAAAVLGTSAQKANNLSDLANLSLARTNLGLGTAAQLNTGTSGANIPLLNGVNTWSADQEINARLLFIGASFYIVTTPIAVSTLPSASGAGAGARHFVGDANSTVFNSIVAGSGSNKLPVFSDGVNWRIG